MGRGTEGELGGRVERKTQTDNQIDRQTDGQDQVLTMSSQS